MVSKALALEEKRIMNWMLACAKLFYMRLKMAVWWNCKTGKADLMLAGAVSASDQLFNPHWAFLYSHFAYSPMDKKFVPSIRSLGIGFLLKAAGMVLLKKTRGCERRWRSHNRSYWVALGLSNDGRGKIPLSPNPKRQKFSLRKKHTR